MKFIPIIIISLFFSIAFVVAESNFNPLTIGHANTLYCRLIGGCEVQGGIFTDTTLLGHTRILGNLTVINLDSYRVNTTTEWTDAYGSTKAWINGTDGEIFVNETLFVGESQLFNSETLDAFQLIPRNERFIIEGSTPEIRLKSETNPNIYMQMKVASANQFDWQWQTQSGTALFNINPVPLDTNSLSRVQFFNLVNTAGPSYINIIDAGPGASVVHRLDAKGDDSYFQMLGGNVGIGTNSPSSKLDVQGNASINDRFITNSSGYIKQWESYLVEEVKYNTGTNTSSPDKLNECMDNEWFNLTEIGGAPGFDYDFMFTNVDSFKTILACVEYDGTTTHDVVMGIYNPTLAIDIPIRKIAPSNFPNCNYFAIDDYTKVVDQGNVSVNMIHVSSGNPSHDLHIGCLKLLR